MDDALIDRLRSDLDAAVYRSEEILRLIGESADEARRRGVFTPARLAIRGRGVDPLATLVRVFLLGETASSAALDTALPSLGASGAARLGICTETDDGDGLQAALSLNSERTGQGENTREWWILSDLDDHLRRGPADPGHVLGVGSATRSLIDQAPTHEVQTSLDLGTGCGVVALHLAGQTTDRVIATDISERALRFARANARLNGVTGIDFRHGNLFEPVAEERFDLVLSNPPFVITPRDGGDPVYEYRDGGFVGDELAARVVSEAPRYLTDRGIFVCLANWETRGGSLGLERTRTWVETAARECGPLASWIVERDVVSTERYGEIWVRDGGLRRGTADFERQLERWIADFSARDVTEVGLGWVRIARTTHNVMRVEQSTGPLSSDPQAGMQDAFLNGVRCSGMTDAEVLSERWIRHSSVAEVREHRPGEESPRAISISSEHGIFRRIHADTILAAMLGACDGELTLAQIADALATILDLSVEEVRAEVTAHVRELTWLGMLYTIRR